MRFFFPSRLVGFTIATVVSAANAEPVLHERLTSSALSCENGVCGAGRAPKSGELPDAITADGMLVPSPSGGAAPSGDEPVVGAGESSRSPRRTLDRETAHEPPGKRPYHTVFNPSEYPFKRGQVYDTVDAAEGLVVASPTPIMEAVWGSNRREASRDAFWGSMVLEATAGTWLALPSVSAEMRVLSASTVPRGTAQFAKDSADNHYVRVTTSGPLRLKFLVDAPRRYFAGPLPERARLGDEPRALLPTMPSAVKERARRVLAHIGVPLEPSTPLSRVLSSLVAYFRNFRQGELPRHTASLYEDLALGQVGACRHRAYAFTITAITAGIPTRYVENELHAFVEVYAPEMGWRRIDLGGAPVDSELVGETDKIPYAVKGGDPFPRPPSFAENPTPSLPSNANGNANANANGNANASRSTSSPLAPVELVTLPSLARGASNKSLPAITLDNAELSAFRGEPLPVSGRITDVEGKGLVLVVELFLEAGGKAFRLARTTSAKDGAFRANVEVPPTLPLGDYRLVAYTPGDDKHSAAMSAR